MSTSVTYVSLNWIAENVINKMSYVDPIVAE